MAMKERIYTIYCHLNKINGKRYIGITSRITAKRWKNGHGYIKNHQPVFAEAIAKYGWDNFEHIILEENIHGQSLAADREKYWVSYYHTWIKDPNCWGYNMTPGGDYCNFTGHHHTIEAKAKISAAAKIAPKHHPTESERKAISIRNTGYKHTAEAKLKIGIASKNHKLSKESCAKISLSKKGKPLTEKHKQALRIKHASPWKTLKVYCVELDKIFNNIDEASAELRVNKENIRKVCKGQRQTAGGYHWNLYSETAAMADLLS